MHVVVLGLTRANDEPAEKRLFSYPDVDGDAVESRHESLSPYLFDASRLPDRHLVVFEQSAPFGTMPRLKTGVQMIDDGHYTFEEDEKSVFVGAEPGAEKFFRKFLGGDEFINGFARWILYLRDIRPGELRALPNVRERVRRVAEYRAASRRPSTVALDPLRLGVDERLGQRYLVIPNTSSEKRQYVPIGWLGPEVIANQKLRILPSAEPWMFGLITSRMHMAWMRAITGRLESRYMYSVGIVYNGFPWPNLDDSAKKLIDGLATAVLEAREKFPGETLAALYDVTAMPPALRKAHRDLDAAVDRLYRREPFADDRARVEHLFALYEKLAAPVIAAARNRGRPRRRPAGEGAGGP